MSTATRRPAPKSGRSLARVTQIGVVLLGLVVVQLWFDPVQTAPAAAAAPIAGSPVVRVSGNHLVNGNGTPIRLLGVDEAGAESVCVAGQGFGVPLNPGPSGAIIDQMKSWKINVVRIPLNEDCWLGVNLPDRQFGGAAYRSAILNYVNRINAAGLAVILDLHWSAPGSQRATHGAVMADENHSPAFWSSVAKTFKGHQGVVFDLYNEPHSIAFSCLIHGGCTAHGFKVAGYDQLISDVRGAGATNVIMVAGTHFAALPTGFSTMMPQDPRHQLAISVHVYDFNAAAAATAWAKWIQLGLLSKVPFVTGELGEQDCTAKFIDTYMKWADTHGVSYLAWTFNTGPCDGPYLLNSKGDPTPYGVGYKAHLASLAARA